MKWATLIAFSLIVSISTQAQVKTQHAPPAPPKPAINFYIAPFDSVKARALKEGRPIFVFFYSEGCDHCERELANVLTNKTVGDFVNSRFIATKIEAGSTDAKPLVEQYNLHLYPSFILFDKKGVIVHMEEGELPVNDLLQFAKKIDIPIQCLYILKRAYDAGNHSIYNCYNYAMAACFHDKEAATKAFKEYFNQQNDSITSERNWVLISHMSYSAELPGFKILLANREAFARVWSDTLVNKYLYEGALSTIGYAADHRESSYFDATRGAFDGCKDSAYFAKYAQAVLYYFTKMQKRDSFALYADKYIHRYIWNDAPYLTSSAHRLLEMTNNPQDYARCGFWLKRSMQLNPNDCRTYATQARLLIREGRRDEALTIVNKGIEVGTANDCDLFPLYGLRNQLSPPKK